MTRNSRATSDFGQGAGRLVHDEDVGFQRQRLGDLDQLLIADAQLAHWLPRRDVAFQLNEQFGGGALHRPVVEQAEPSAFLAAQEDVGGRGQVLDQVQLLVDDADAGGLGVARAGEADRLAAQQQLPLEVGDDAGQDLHQRALPAPFSPTMACSSPGSMSNETSSRATTPGKRLRDMPIAMRAEQGRHGTFWPRRNVDAARRRTSAQQHQRDQCQRSAQADRGQTASRSGFMTSGDQDAGQHGAD